jgi:membrane associated rhomboid family serine protease
MRNISLVKRPFPYRFHNVTLILIVINVAFYLIKILFPRTFAYLALTPVLVFRFRFFWQVFTYMFMHGGMTHILFNMLALFLFGSQLERRLGSYEFLAYYLVSGLGAGLFTLVFNWYAAPGMAGIPVVGASGAIYGLLLAYATLFPHSVIFIFGIFPLKAPVAVLLFAAIAIFSQLSNTAVGIAHLTHLAGLIFGYLYFRIRLGEDPLRVFFRRR